MKLNRSNLYIITTFLLVLAGCHSLGETPASSLPAQLERSPSASIAIEKEIHDRKIVFISEEHSVVNPILFLKENIRAFYGAGVRYLFLEGGFPPLPDSENYRFPIFYPWSLTGWKYEGVELAEVINELNSSLPEKDRLHVVFPEAGNAEPSTFSPNEAPTFINERDRYAYRRIQDYMKKTEKNEKAIVFYGGAHGSKEISIHENRGGGVPLFDWKPLGAYLKEYYKDMYLAVDYRYAVQFSWEQTSSENWFKIDKHKYVKSEALARWSNYQWGSKYDAVILEQEPKFGLGYQFVPNDANLRVIFKSLRRIDNSFKQLVQKSQNMRFQPLGSYLTGIYYLKLYFGEHFNYRLWNPNTELSTALDRLEEYAFSPGKSPSKLIVTPKYTSDSLYEYCKLMYTSGIDQYINHESSRAALIGQITESMMKATEIFPNDLWALYWLAFIHTESNNYEKAITECELIMSSPIGGCMEILPRVYEMASKCAFKLGLKEKSDHYQRIATELRNEQNIEVIGLLDVM